MQETTKVTRPLLRALGLEGFKEVDMWKNESVLQIFTLYVSDEQIASLTKMSRFKWRFTKILWNSELGKCAVALHSSENSAWVLPSGAIVRATAREKSVVLPANWETK